MERVVRTGKCKNTKQDKLTLMDGLLISGIKCGSLAGFPQVIYFSVNAFSQKTLEKFEQQTGFKLDHQIQVQVN